MDKAFPIFRSWVPEWLVKLVLFIIIMPSLVLFFLPLANVNAGAGYYGGEPADMQFAVALFYAGYAGFYFLERRFFSYLAAKEYFILFTVLQIALAAGCYHTHELYLLFPFRFMQGMLFAGTVNVSLTLMFTRLHSERAREVSFSVFFGLLLCALPFTNFVTAGLIDSFNYNIVYQCTAFAYVPGLLLLLLCMNNVRLNVRFPLYRLDWASFALYSMVLCLVGYLLIYGQEYYWLTDNRILYSCAGIVVVLPVYLLRQRSLKRPYTHLAVFRYRNFKAGCLFLFIFYICRFASGVTNTFFSAVLQFDSLHVSYINLINIAGIVSGVIISCCLVLQQKHIRHIWLPGFSLLLVFHAGMFFLFDTEANASNFYAPLFIQGLATGMLMVPTIVYAIAAVPVSIGVSASGMLLAVRYLGFCTSIALINYFELLEKSRHYNAFQDQLTKLNPAVQQTLARQSRRLASHGIQPQQAAKAAHKLLVQTLNRQTQLRFAMDYYEMMSWLLFGTVLLIAVFPYLNKTVVYLRSERLSPL